MPGRTDNQIKNYWNSHIKRKLLSRGLDPRSHLPLQPPQLPHNSNITWPSRPAPDHEIPAFQNCTAPEITDFFQHHRPERSPIESAASDAEEHPDLNLNLCISLPSNSTPAISRTSSVDKTVESRSSSADRTVDSNSNSGHGLCWQFL